MAPSPLGLALEAALRGIIRDAMHQEMVLLRDEVRELRREIAALQRPAAPGGARHPSPANTSAPRPMAYTINDAAAVFSLSRSSIWRLIKAKQIATFKAGGRTLVDRASMEAYHARQLGGG